MEFRERNGDIGTKNISSLDPSAEDIRICSLQIPINPYEQSDYFREQPDGIEDVRDCLNLQNSLVDVIWSKYGGEDDEIEN